MKPGIFETSGQLWVLLVTIYGGALLGVFFDALFITNRVLGGRRVLTAIFDALFWVVATTLCFGLLYFAHDGAFSLADALGFALGAALYFLGPGRAVRWLYLQISRALRALWKRFKGTGLYRLLSK